MLDYERGVERTEYIKNVIHSPLDFDVIKRTFKNLSSDLKQ